MAFHVNSCAGLGLAIGVIASGVGCFGPNPNYLGVHGYVDDDSSDDPTEHVESEGPQTETDDETETETETETDSGDEPPSVAPPNPGCGDKTVDPGEFCFEIVELPGWIDVQSLAVDDLDGDGFRDLAIGRKDDVFVLFGDGLGGFPRQADLPEPNSSYHGAAAGDLDGDELADLVVSRANGDAVLVYRSLGGGDFADPVAFATGDEPRRLVLARLDDDLVLDLAVACLNHHVIDVLLGDGFGGFGPRTSYPSGGDQPFEVGIGTFDADSSPDLIVGNLNGKSFTILRGDGLGQLEIATVHPLDGRPRSTAIADFNLDGRLDVATALEDLDRVRILLGDGLGGLLDIGLELPVGQRPMGAVAEDFDNDGVVDLLVINRDDATVSLLFGDPSQPGQFSSAVLVTELGGLTGMLTVISADLNADGVRDVVIGGTGIRAMISNP